MKHMGRVLLAAVTVVSSVDAEWTVRIYTQLVMRNSTESEPSKP